ncbi:MAG: hypothetical protein BWX84_02411 [Verrucomicrobia bacterium ADurb.Bin118]|nr:MAG: hypothetical protein BWX84_02411 [Verrucomicrobia bacterium ADurb.Bin118]
MPLVNPNNGVLAPTCCPSNREPVYPGVVVGSNVLVGALTFGPNPSGAATSATVKPSSTSPFPLAITRA